MRRYYALGIIFLILALNTPETTGDIRNAITFYSPYVRDQLSVARNKADPVLLSIFQDLQSKTTILSNGNVIRTVNTQVDTSDTFSMSHAPSITAEQFNKILADYNSPATGVGIPITAYAQEKHIDTAYVLYMFIQESTAGTNPNWNKNTRNPGNIICAGYNTCAGNFRQYATWEEGFKAQIDLLANYRDTNKLSTIDAAIERWAPPNENDTQGYIDGLKEHVTTWRQANAGQFVATSSEIGETVISKPAMTQGRATSMLSLGGCLADTVPNALQPSAGLQDITIHPGENWSFNENWIIVDENKHYCGNQPYGGICDMATRYQIAAKELGLETQYQRHPGGLNDVSPDDAVVIWSGGVRGGQDLYIVNTTNKVVKMRGNIQNGEFIVTAYFV